jgi:hypothetical protein
MGDSLRHSGEQGYVLAKAFHNFLMVRMIRSIIPAIVKKKKKKRRERKEKAPYRIFIKYDYHLIWNITLFHSDLGTNCKSQAFFLDISRCNIMQERWQKR